MNPGSGTLIVHMKCRCREIVLIAGAWQTWHATYITSILITFIAMDATISRTIATAQDSLEFGVNCLNYRRLILVILLHFFYDL